MNICLLSKLFYKKKGGVETYTYRMAKSYAKRGHHVHIVTLKGDKKYYQDNLGPKIHVHAFDYKPPQFRGYWKLQKILPLSEFLFHLAVRRKIRDVVRKCFIDVVEVRDFEGYRPIRKTPFPLVVRLGGYHGFEEVYVNRRRNLYKNILWLWTKSFLKKADALTAVSHYFAENIAETFQLNRHKIKVVYNGIDLEFFQPDPQIDRQKDHILFVGKLTHSKGLDVITKAIPLILEKNPQARFTLIGRDTFKGKDNPSYREYLREQLKACRVEIIDEMSSEELVKYYQRSVICLFPSLFEPLGTVCLESMACGCATIASRVGGMKEMIRHRINGLLIDPGDHMALANAVIELIRSDRLREGIVTYAMEDVKANFNIDIKAEKTLNVYRDIVQRGVNRNKKSFGKIEKRRIKNEYMSVKQIIS